MTPAQTMLDVAREARILGMQPVALARELVRDRVPIIQVSKRTYRVAAEDFAAWKARRQQCAVELFTQADLRRDYVKGAPVKHEKRGFTR